MWFKVPVAEPWSPGIEGRFPKNISFEPGFYISLGDIRNNWGFVEHYDVVKFDELHDCIYYVYEKSHDEYISVPS